MFESRISAGATEKLPCSENLSISSWSYDMEGHAKKCVERYCELSNKTTQQLHTYWKTWYSVVSGQTCTIHWIMDWSLWQTIMSIDILHSSHMWTQTLQGWDCFKTHFFAGDLEDSKSTSGPQGWLKPFHPNIVHYSNSCWVWSFHVCVSFFKPRCRCRHACQLEARNCGSRVKSHLGWPLLLNAWISVWMQMSEDLSIAWMNGWMQMSEELNKCWGSIKKVGQTRCRAVFALTVAGRPSVGRWSIRKKWCRTEPTIWRHLSSETSSTAGSSNFSVQGEWCRKTVLVRGWAPFGSPASQKIDPIEYKKVANEFLSCLPHCLQNNVMVRAPFAANFQISFGLKDGGGWDSCRAVQEALIAVWRLTWLMCVVIPSRSRLELSPHRKTTLTNMFRAETFLKKSGVNPEFFLLCPKSCKVLARWSNEDLGETPKGSNAWVWHLEKCSGCGVSLSGWEDFKNWLSGGSQNYRVSREKCELCVLSWNVLRVSGGLDMLVQHISELGGSCSTSHTSKNERNLREWWMIWIMLILSPQTCILLARKLCCMSSRTMKQWSRWS